jgi:riboflavin kinase/FMN adenylyltransferase
MKVIYGIRQIKKFRKPVVALGVFDGVHRGHRLVLGAAVKKARQIGGTSVVLTFWPHPQKEESLLSLEHRLRLFAELGVDISVVINFNRRFASLKAEDFIEEILLKKIGAQYVYIGSNFRFGRGAKGTLETLRKYCLKVRGVRVAKINKRPISSTSIRRLIKKGKLVLAQKLLTRRVSILGTVIRGDSLGRRLGFPTANIDPHHEVTPAQGVYAVKVLLRARKFNGLCYIGSRPTLRKGEGRNIEVYIFNFKQDIYGEFLEIQFLKKIRGEIKFASLCILAEQVKNDVLTAKRLFSHH